MRTFLKAIGSYKKPITKAPFNGVYDDVYIGFPTRRPDIRKGEHLFLYASGGRLRIFALARAVGNPMKNPNKKGDRWKLQVKYINWVPVDFGIHMRDDVTGGQDLINAKKRVSYIELKQENQSAEIKEKLREAEGKWNKTAKETQHKPTDLPEPPPRFKAQVSRIIRDTPLARDLKSLYGFACQVCGCDFRVETAPNSFYIEVHHIRPLGGVHAGSDNQANMLVLCPNHHAMFDYGIPRFLSPYCIEIAGVAHDLNKKHELSPDCIEYHNKECQISNRKLSVILPVKAPPSSGK